MVRGWNDAGIRENAFRASLQLPLVVKAAGERWSEKIDFLSYISSASGDFKCVPEETAIAFATKLFADEIRLFFWSLIILRIMIPHLSSYLN